MRLMGYTDANNINHSLTYNNGGISHIYLLDIEKFGCYIFKGGRPFESCFVEDIEGATPYIQISTVNESNFTENKEGNIYKQKLNTFIRTLDSRKTAEMMKIASKKYVVLFRDMGGKGYTFGSDGGTQFSFYHQSGQVGETSGYGISLECESTFPLFEIALSVLENKDFSKVFNDIFNEKFN